MHMKKLFGTDGIRGVAGKSPLDAQTVYAVGLAIAHHLGASPKVLIGMDTRESSEWIAATLTAGLTEGGAKVESAGVITTPAVAYLTRAHAFSAGIVISASHNPWQDNGIKLFGPDGFKLPDETEIAIEAEIFKRLEATADREANVPATEPVVNEADRTEYVQFLLAAVPEGAPLILSPGQRALVPTGLTIALPPGYEAQVRPRSGLASKHGVTVLNSPGTVDADYRGEIGVLLVNHGDGPFSIRRGERIAQMVIAPVVQVELVSAAKLSATGRGSGGFGSTGD